MFSEEEKDFFVPMLSVVSKVVLGASLVVFGLSHVHEFTGYWAIVIMQFFPFFIAYYELRYPIFRISSEFLSIRDIRSSWTLIKVPLNEIHSLETYRWKSPKLICHSKDHVLPIRMLSKNDRETLLSCLNQVIQFNQTSEQI